MDTDKLKKTKTIQCLEMKIAKPALYTIFFIGGFCDSGFLSAAANFVSSIFVFCVCFFGLAAPAPKKHKTKTPKSKFAAAQKIQNHQNNNCLLEFLLWFFNEVRNDGPRFRVNRLMETFTNHPYVWLPRLRSSTILARARG